MPRFSTNPVRPHLRAAAVLSACLASCAAPSNRPAEPPPTLRARLAARAAALEAHEPAIVLSGALTLTEAEGLAVQRHPALLAAAAEARALSAEVKASARRPNPTLELDVEDAFGSGEFEGFDGAQFTLGVTQTLELGGKRAQRRRAAEAALDVGRQAERSAASQVLREVRQAYVDLAAAQALEALTARSAELAERIASTVHERVEAGAVPRAEEHRARIAAAEARLELLDAASARSAARECLGARLQIDAASLEAADELVLGAPPQAGLLLESAPSLLVLELEAQRAAVEVELARAQRSPDLELGAGVRRYEALDDEAFVLSVGLPLQIFDAGRDAVTAAEERQRAARHRLDSQRRALEAEARALSIEMAAAHDAVRAVEDAQLTKANDLVDSMRLAYAEGKRTLVEVLDAERALASSQRRRITELARYHRARIELQARLGVDQP